VGEANPSYGVGDLFHERDQEIAPVERMSNQQVIPADIRNGLFREVILQNTGNVLAFSCPHLPYEHPRYLEFLDKIRKYYGCETIINLGDFVDHHGVSMHEKDPDGNSAGSEVELVKARINDWVDVFPDMLLTYGNHDRLPERNAFKNGVSKSMIKNINEIYGMPLDGWKWYDRIIADRVLYFHGTGRCGKNSAQQWVDANKMSCVVGHVHSNLSVTYCTTPYDRFFGMSVGCGIQPNSFAFAYNKEYSVRPVLGCSVILDSGRQPIPIPMYIGDR
jgi:predicted phosphodiesterase